MMHVPWLGPCNPKMTFKRVLFPQPDFPITPQISLAGTVREKSLRTTLVPYPAVILWREIISKSHSQRSQTKPSGGGLRYPGDQEQSSNPSGHFHYRLSEGGGRE